MRKEMFQLISSLISVCIMKITTNSEHLLLLRSIIVSSFCFCLFVALRHSRQYFSHICDSTCVCRQTEDMCLKNTDAPGGNSWNMAKISKFYILTPHHNQGHGMWVKCEQSIDGLTVQVWLLYHHPNFKYCTLFESRKELWTNWRMNRQTDDPITRCPRWTFQAEGKKTSII